MIGWLVRLATLSRRLEALELRVAELEGLLTPEQLAQRRLIRQAEAIVARAKELGQL